MHFENKLLFRVMLGFSVLLSFLGCEKKIDAASFDSLYEPNTLVPSESSSIYHLGHSLVNRDMPYMFAQLNGREHHYRSQIGWGTTLRGHWEPKVAINGFESENAHPHYRDVFESIKSKEYGHFVLTEMVEIKDAIRYHKSSEYLSKFTAEILANRSDARIYLYESWHNVDDPEGWLNRLDHDFEAHWLQQILFPALNSLEQERPIYLIPVGQVFLNFFSAY